MNLLEVQQLTAAYDNVLALKAVSIEVQAGEVVAVLGANGAGKSTLLKTIVGLVASREGRVVFDGQDIATQKPHQRLELGITLCPEGRRLFPQMTVFENIRMGAYRLKDRGVFRRRLALLYDMFPKLAERGKQVASSLSGGEQQMVAIARALVSQPRLLLLDEPTLGLAPKMIHEVARLVRLIHAEGIAVILVEQNAKLALRISDRGYVLENGAVSLVGQSADLLADRHVQQIYLGG
ncbi:MAG: high-affinity branched-chain amino acid transport ATP-binding protein [Rhodoferax sp.]|nr:high-affinity branched-chain amino acid transport ATP-binding protein [Rhodoferax sp.]